QSIFRFQGASVENIIDYYKRYQQHLQLITLTKNYRSQQSVLDAASQVIENNQTRIASYLNENSSPHTPKIDKHLQSQTKLPSAPLELSIFETEQQENFEIAKEIQTLISQGTAPSEIAVLFHKHADAQDLAEIMLKEKIPFDLRAGQDILQDLQISKLLALFRTIENPHHNEQLAQTLFVDFLQMPRADLLSLNYYYYQNRLEKQGYSLFHLLSQKDHLLKAHLTEPEKFQKFASNVVNWRDLAENQTLNLFFETVVKESGFLEYLMKSQSRIETLNRLNTLFTKIKKVTRKNHSITITAFLEELELRAENKLRLVEEPLQISREAVQLMTAHASKGLEFQHVFLLKCTDRNWGKRSNQDRIHLPKGLIKANLGDEKLEFLEDDRRLFYVTLTRAKQMAHLSYSKFRSEAEKMKEDLPSRFLEEIPAELLSREDYTQASPGQIEALEALLLQPAEAPFNEIEKALLTRLASEHVISPTSLNNYLVCPRKFLLQNLIRIPQAKRRSAALGTAIHAALDNYFREYRRKKIKPPVELLTLKFQYYLDKELLKPKDYQELLEIGKNLINDFFEAKQESFNPDTITEYNFSSHGVNIDGIAITGKIDKIEPSSDHHTLTITDFKTGNADTGTQKVSHGGDYWRQVIFYKILCDNSPRFAREFPNTQTSIGQIEFLEKSRSKKVYLNPTVPLDKSSIDEVIENIRFVHTQINALEFEKIPQGEECQKCPFFNICWKN
ncbi:ATP-dependent helicase, partial [Candidatus Peregrinibacteria bacterium]|nr:ATP-dependent helicase [Candidatus Peregrinibacteria bacterium]